MSHFMCHVSCVMYYVSCIMCQVSSVTCHMSGVIFSLFFGQSGEARWWRVCYQEGLPRRVHNVNQQTLNLYYLLFIKLHNFKIIWVDWILNLSCLTSKYFFANRSGLVYVSLSRAKPNINKTGSSAWMNEIIR